MNRILWALLITVMAGVVVTSSWSRIAASSPRATALPIYGQAPEFSLTDQEGRPFLSSALKGTVWVADFIFTSCAGSCPQMTAQMAALQKRLPQEIQFVSISVDPARDRPDLLRRYAESYGADLKRWRFLTGEPPAIERLVKEGFRLSYAEGTSPEEPITHSVRFLLVDGQGTIRGAYDGTDPKAVERLIQDARSR